MAAAGISLIDVAPATIDGQPAARLTRRVDANIPVLPPVYRVELLIKLRQAPGKPSRLADIIVAVDDTPEQRALADQILDSVRPL